MATPTAIPMDSAGSRASALASAWLRARTQLARISPEAGDALLYFGSAVFALITIYTSENALYQVWGRMALSPFVFGTVASVVRRRRGAAGPAAQRRRAAP